MIEVGDNEKKFVSKLNRELYLKAEDIFSEQMGLYWHMGWSNVGAYIDWLESEYDIVKRSKGG